MQWKENEIQSQSSNSTTSWLRDTILSKSLNLYHLHILSVRGGGGGFLLPLGLFASLKLMQCLPPVDAQRMKQNNAAQQKV